MNKYVKSMYENICIFANSWHERNLDLFDLDKEFICVQPDYRSEVIKLLYHNYQIWHFIELYTSPDSGTVLFVYDGGIKHNKLRNDCIESLDQELCGLQKGTGKINSETIGSVMDRIGILYIKLLHLKDTKDERVQLIEKQVEMLLNCASELMDDMENGERQCVSFSRFKIEYSGQ